MKGRCNQQITKQLEAADWLPAFCFRRCTEVCTWSRVTWLST